MVLWKSENDGTSPVAERSCWQASVFSLTKRSSAHAEYVAQGKIVGFRNVETEGETMDKDSFKERERAQEEGYFRAQDAKLHREAA